VNDVKDILAVITTYRESRGWSEYQLAERSGLPQSTISSWYRKNMVPTIPSLEKICDAFGITLSQLFSEEDAPVSLTASQKQLLEKWSRLTEDQQAAVFTLIDKM
jgi:transcriptional regulator with XRE-family HTH domain